MLGWALKRSLGRDVDDPDDTQFEPDTPGPVFAARAFKSALFGTPARPDDNTRVLSDNAKPAVSTSASSTAASSTVASTVSSGSVSIKTAPSTAATSTTASTDNGKKESRPAASTPGRRPAGILLTPGTGTSRRKRVTFGRDIEVGENKRKKELRIDPAGLGHASKRPSLFGEDSTGSNGSTGSTHLQGRPRTKLVEALENARRLGVENQREVEEAEKSEKSEKTKAEENQEKDVDDPWEEVDDDDDDNNNNWDPDVTVDLNEPHSQSGRYWKAQFQHYQEDARAEMSKLLRYKQLAKSYAKMKDAEAVDLQAKLQEEKDRVATMEANITDLARQLARGRTTQQVSDSDYKTLISDLTRETARAVQYRNQVKELEAAISQQSEGVDGADKDAEDDADDDDHLGMAARGSPIQSRRRNATSRNPSSRNAASPRTQLTLLETQRELRRARDQARELTQAKAEARRLRSELRVAERAAEQQVRRLEQQNKTLAADLAAKEEQEADTRTQMQDLEKRASAAEDARRRQDEELRLLQRRYASLKDDAKARVGEAEQVLMRKNNEIAELKERARKLEKQLSEKREKENKWSAVGDDFAIRLDATAEAAEPELPQRLPVRPATAFDKENRGKESKEGKEGKEVRAHVRPKSALLLSRDARKDEDGAGSLRRRRGISPLRTVQNPQAEETEKAQKAEKAEKAEKVLETRRPARAARWSAQMAEDEPHIDLFGNQFARLGDTATKQKEKEGTEKESPDVADASRLSISSQRVAEVLAKSEKRRAQRRRELESLRKKEAVHA